MLKYNYLYFGERRGIVYQADYNRCDTMTMLLMIQSPTNLIKKKPKLFSQKKKTIGQTYVIKSYLKRNSQYW